jgi:hypothetical protein
MGVLVLFWIFIINLYESQVICKGAYLLQVFRPCLIFCLGFVWINFVCVCVFHLNFFFTFQLPTEAKLWHAYSYSKSYTRSQGMRQRGGNVWGWDGKGLHLVECTNTTALTLIDRAESATLPPCSYSWLKYSAVILKTYGDDGSGLEWCRKQQSWLISGLCSGRHVGLQQVADFAVFKYARMCKVCVQCEWEHCIY